MNSKNLENLIIIILVGIIIYMIYKRNERMENTQIPQEISQEMQKDILKIKSENVLTITESVKPEIHSETKDVYDIKPKPEYPYDSNLLLPPGKIRSENVNEFLNEYMNYSRFGNKIDHISTNDEINAYRKSFLDFRNVTNTSSHGFDPVDEMNLEKISGLYKDGLKVKDVYDKISAKNFDTTKIDVESMQFNDRVDDYLHSNTFEYDNDEVNNGGFFFNNIKGSENENHLKAFP